MAMDVDHTCPKQNGMRPNASVALRRGPEEAECGQALCGLQEGAITELWMSPKDDTYNIECVRKQKQLEGSRRSIMMKLTPTFN